MLRLVEMLANQLEVPAYVSIRQLGLIEMLAIELAVLAYVSIRQHMSAYVNIRRMRSRTSL